MQHLILFTIIFITALFAPFGHAETPEKVTVQLKWLHQFQFAGYYAAKAKGFFSDEGLDVTIRQRNTATSQIDDVLQNRAEYGVSDAGLVLTRMQGKPVVLLSQIFQHSPLTLIALKESGIRTPYDLLGHTVMSDLMSNGNASLLAMMQKTLGDLDLIKQVPQSYRKEDLLENKIQAISGYISNQPYWFEQQNQQVTIIDPRDYGIDFYGDNLFTTETEVLNHPERVDKVIRAVKRGWLYALDHQEEIVDLIMEEYGTQGLTRDHLQFEAGKIEEMILPDFIELGQYEQTRYIKIGETYAQLGFVDDIGVDPGFFYEEAGKGKILLTDDERSWIIEHPEIAFAGDPNWLPYEAFLQDGTYIGIVADHLALIEKKTGLTFNPVSVSSWTESLAIANAGKVSIISGDAADVILNKQFIPVETYSQNPIVIIMDSQQNYVEELEEIKNQKIAIIKDYGYTSDILKFYPDFKFIEVENIQEGLEGVSQGRFDAMLSTMALASYTIAEMGLHNVKVVGKTPIIMDLTLFISKDQPILHSIINKALKSISKADSQEILQGWIRSRYVERTNYWAIIQISFVLLLILTIIIVWNRKLQREIKTRQKTEISLRRANLIVENSSVVLFRWKVAEDWPVEFVSENVSLFGYTADDLVSGRISFISIVHSDDLERITSELNEFFDTGVEVFNQQYRIVSPRGGIYWVDDRTTVEKDSDGNVTHCQGVVIDVTERIQAEKSLRNSEEKFHTLTTSSPIGMFLDDAQGNVIFINERCAELIGVPEKEALNLDWVPLIHPDDRERVTTEWASVVKNGDKFHMEYRWVHSDGRVVWTLGDITPIKDSEGEISSFVGTLTDITQRKQSELEQARLERELQQAHKMEALGQLTGGVAHDFNNILGIIIGYTSMCQVRYGSEIPKKAMDYLGTVMKASERAKSLVGQMLTFSRADPADARPLQLAPLVKGNIEMLHSILPSSIEINLNCEENIPTIMMDSVKLQQLLMNLCLNAKDAMQGVGILKIELGWHRGVYAECADCHQSIRGDWIELSVADTGCGMTPDVLKHIFEPFYTSKKIGEGSGMGLSVVHGILSGYGGHVLVETALGKGSAFRLLFPPFIEEVQELPVVESFSAELNQGEGQCVLILDDEFELAEYIADLLALNGYQTTIKTDSEEALRLFQNDPDHFSLLVTDQTMPGLTGVEVIKQIRKISPEFPVILCTGYSEGLDEKDAEKLDIRYLGKPIDADKLVQSAGELLGLTAK